MYISLYIDSFKVNVIVFIFKYYWIGLVCWLLLFSKTQFIHLYELG